MGDYNKVMVLGRLTRDPEVRYTPSGTAVCDIGIATNRRVPAGEGNWRDETTYVDVTLWRRQAEIAGQYLAKGREVFIEGHLELDSWEDKNSGQKRSRLKVVCDSLQLIGGGQGGGGGQQGGGSGYQSAPPAQSAPQRQSAPPQQQQQQPQQQQQQQDAPPPQEPAFEPEPEDDIPF